MATTLDEMFDLVESMHVPEGYHAEIIEGKIVVSPQRDVHWSIIRLFTRVLEDAFGLDAKILSDVRIDFPGVLNGYAPDVALLRDGAQKTGRAYDYRDVRLVVEVVSQSSRRDDYGAKLETYAQAGVATYVIADPLTGQAHVHESPEPDGYQDIRTYPFGAELAITDPALTVDTKLWPRDE
jgi:Uma2 family endonuclease